MVSFQCEGCGDVLTKKKLDGHRNQCYGASYSCLDCMIHFQGTDYRSHTSCISEAEKYQGALYRPEKEKKNKQNNSKALVPHKAYVEDADDEYQENTHVEIVESPMPAAPSPPSAAPGFTSEGSPVNVFDFLVASSTPNQSRLELTAPEPMHMFTDGREEEMDDDDEEEEEEDTQRSLVRVRFGDAAQTVNDLIEYGNGPVATDVYQYETPAPKQRSERKKEKKDRDHKEEKKDKKRKRLHVETHDLSSREDETMTDAPPVLHSGLTGGLNRLMSRPEVFPPSPDYSGGDAAEPSPGSPLKKTKHTKTVKRGRVDTISNGIMSLIGSKRVSSREHSDERPKRKQRKHREASDRPKMIEYKPMAEGAVQEESQMVVYTPHSPRAELLLSFVNKGPDSERGVSMNKALKRYHRERVSKGLALGKALEEKELWRSLRMKKNDRGEIVLFL
ncbi:uncharacterized protein LY89DRAFT_313446 [Mollisia scopiformis]|uniref:Zinc finger C2H2 LYAR-type domain-containing protein n=1 Tax=Mollisia scopiformis TaxID=149040 RepID=A0A194XT68_MOLSC|nr:uncharacterized protein LY89DRAFT_313446 [Mollisia scopiformis]KUJ22892.1 hypothetical protein LY89DRAFT_313446 [Mollisia scopiformis]